MNDDKNERCSWLPPSLIESWCKPEVNTKLKPMSYVPQRLAVTSLPPLVDPYSTVWLTVAVLLARFGSTVSSVAVATSLITVPDGAVTTRGRAFFH